MRSVDYLMFSLWHCKLYVVINAVNLWPLMAVVIGSWAQVELISTLENSTKTLQRLYKDSIKTLQILYKNSTNTLQILYKYSTNTLQILYKDSTNLSRVRHYYNGNYCSLLENTCLRTMDCLHCGLKAFSDCAYIYA